MTTQTVTMSRLCWAGEPGLPSEPPSTDGLTIFGITVRATIPKVMPAPGAGSPGKIYRSSLFLCGSRLFRGNRWGCNDPMARSTFYRGKNPDQAGRSGLWIHAPARSLLPAPCESPGTATNSSLRGGETGKLHAARTGRDGNPRSCSRPSSNMRYSGSSGVLGSSPSPGTLCQLGRWTLVQPDGDSTAPCHEHLHPSYHSD